MLPAVLVVCFLFAAPTVLVGCATDDGSSVSDRLAALVRTPDNYVYEEQLLELFEQLRRLLREGDPENDIPPLEPVRIRKLGFFDFYLEETELKGVFRDVVIALLSNFEIKNLSLNLRPKMEVKMAAFFDELSFSGFYDLRGSLFGELPIDGFGPFRVNLRNLTIPVEAILRSKAGILQVQDLKATFDLDSISVAYKNRRESEEEKEFAEDFVLGILRRFRADYLPRLLTTLKIVINDFIVRMANREEIVPGGSFRSETRGHLADNQNFD